MELKSNINNKKVIIIAEIGENHMGNMDIAKTLIKKASEAGADYVKFQSYKYQDFKPDDPEYEWFKRVSLSDEAHISLKECAQDNGIKFLSSPFSLERAKFLIEKLGLKEIKIASGMMLNFRVLDYVGRNVDAVFLSTGMSNISEIKEALSRLNKVPICYLLHCVTQYPLHGKDANLLAIRTLQCEFPNLPVGYSDHSVGTLAVLTAVALGAKVIEKHITLDKGFKEGTDHILSVTPEELREMIKDIRSIEELLGDGKKVPRQCEEKIKEFVRNRFI